MNPQFSQPKGSVSKETNKESIARRFGCKKSEVVYAKTGQSLSGYKVIYDKATERAYALPANLGAVTITSITDGILTHSSGTVDLGALAVLRGEYVNLIENFTTGFTIRVKNEVVNDGDISYRWAGALPKTVSTSGSVDASGGVSGDAWVAVTLAKHSYYKAFGSFTLGGRAKSGYSALYNPTDKMYYTPKAGVKTVAPGSTPDSTWVCVGILDRFEIGDVRNFLAVGDGVAVDTNAIQLAVAYANFSKTAVYVPGGYTFLCDKIQFTGISNITIAGNGKIKMIGGRTGAFYYADGGQFNFVGNNDSVRIIGLELDGNRSGSPSYTGFNHGLQFVTGTGDFRSNNGGDNKPNKNIYISGCKFHDQGSFNAGLDKFGDAIYLFGVDGIVIENNEFVDVGRWGVAASDVFNLRVCKNKFNCSKAGTVALGFVDIENESTDNVNGSYSRDIVITDNNLYGYGQILVGAGSNSENNQGAQHYLRNVLVANNTLTVAGGAHSNSGYLTNLVFMGVAPFCNVATTQGVVENSNIVFANNTLRNEISSLSVGMGINAQGIGQTNIVKGVIFANNNIYGFNKGILCQGGVTSTGYSLREVMVESNHIDCADQANSIGIRLASTQLVDCMASNNTVIGTTTRAISLEDGVGVGAVDTSLQVQNNKLKATSGTNMFANVYRAALVGNLVNGGALALDATITKIDKDYGNTWNSLTRSVTGFTVAAGAQYAQGGIDIGSQSRFGYTVQAAAPFIMDQGTWHCNVTEPGFAILLIKNNTATPISKSTDNWTITVEKR